MIFTLDVMRARKGDCLLLHFGTKQKPGLVLIDGGPSQVYKPFLRPRLGEIRKARGLGAQDTLRPDILMVSHIDDDHIAGVLELMNELAEQKRGQKPLLLKPRSVWFNSFDDILGDDPKTLRTKAESQFGPAAISNEPDVDDDDLAPSVAKILASVEQGNRLRDRIRELGFSPNAEVGGSLIAAVAGEEPLQIGGGLELTVIGPPENELLDLKKEHDKWVKDHKEDEGSATIPAAFTDTSVANLSSIVVLAKVQSKSILLTGDARGDKILEGLELAGLLSEGQKLKLDILKMPHHGSDRDMAPIFFEKVIADHYVFSGDGEHGNPERTTIEMLFGIRGTAGYRLYFTYPIAQIDVEREKDWNKERTKEKKRAEKKKGTKVREEWDAKSHSLAALFSAKAFKEGEHYHIAKPEGLSIELLDPLGF